MLFKGLYAPVHIKHIEAPMHINYTEALVHITCDNIYRSGILRWACDKCTPVL